MSIVRLNDFKNGMDRTNRVTDDEGMQLWLLRNLRPFPRGGVGLRQWFNCVDDLNAGASGYNNGAGACYGLFAGLGSLVTFYVGSEYWATATFDKLRDYGTINGLDISLKLVPLESSDGGALVRVHFCRWIAGSRPDGSGGSGYYVVAEYTGTTSGTTYKHFWIVTGADAWAATTGYAIGDTVNPTVGFDGRRYSAGYNGTLPAVWQALGSYTIGDKVLPTADPTGEQGICFELTAMDWYAPVWTQPPAGDPPPPIQQGGGGGRYKWPAKRAY